MKRYHLLILVLFIIALIPYKIMGQVDGCVECHTELGDEFQSIVESFSQDVHRQAGLSCSDCHGGNPQAEDMDIAKDRSFKGVPERAQITDFCASCHSDFNYIRRFNPSLRVDQLTVYWTSEHGQLLKKGNTEVAVCTDCHGTHSIQSALHPKSWTFPWNLPQTCGRCHSDQAYMKNYKIPTSQESDYRESVHAHALFEKKDLSAPVCNDCHGNHGAAPPEISSISLVCRQCHPSTGELFTESPHKESFAEMGYTECEACHGNHKIIPPTDDMLGTGEGAVCIQCHEEGSQPFQVAGKMKEKIGKFSNSIHDVENILQAAHNKGVEVSEAQFLLREANTLLIMIRNLTHRFSLELIEEKITEGDEIVSEVKEAGEEALKEADFRRRGLVIAVFFLALMAIAVYLKVRQIDRKTLSSHDSGAQ